MMFKKRYVERYVERYEIEFKLCGLWAYAGTVYPRYQWKITHPWYFLGLVKVPVLVDPLSDALVARLDAVIAAGNYAYSVTPPTPARIWQVERKGLKIVKAHMTWETAEQ